MNESLERVINPAGTGSLEGRHAVVTGGGSGIGAATASNLVQAGARVTIMGRTETRLTGLSERLNVGWATADVTDGKSLEIAFQKATDREGPVDILVNNAGSAESAPFLKTDRSLWRRMIDVNLNGVFNCTQAVLSSMLERDTGRIINVASTAALTGYPYVSAYCAAKHGVIGLTRSLALELANSAITINAVCPGYTRTQIVEDAVANITRQTGRSPEQALQSLLKTNPQKRLIEPEEVAATINWLCSDQAASITGQSIAVAGGEIM